MMAAERSDQYSTPNRRASTRPGVWMALVVCAVFQPAMSRSDEPDSTTSRRMQEALRWLPLITETTAVSRGPFEFPKHSHDDLRTFSFSNRIQLLPMWLIPGIEDGKYRDAFEGQSVVVAVEGSRRFRNPRGLGAMPFDGAQIVQFTPTTTLEGVFESIHKGAPGSVTLSGIHVAIYVYKWESDTWRLHIATPEPGLLIVATDRTYLEELLKRRKDLPDDSALPEDMPEWKLVNTMAPVWAVRHFRTEHASNDPTSPLNRNRPEDERDLEAIGFVFWYDASNKVAKAVYISKSPNALDVTKTEWLLPEEGINPTIVEASNGIVEINTPIDGGIGDRGFLHILQAALGHGIYL